MPGITLTTSKQCPKCGNVCLDWSNPDEVKVGPTHVGLGTVCPICQWTILVQATMPTYTTPVMIADEEDVVVMPRRHLKRLYQNTELHTRKCNERTAQESEALEWCAAFFGAVEPSEEDDLHG